MVMLTHVQIPQKSTCGPSCLMMAGRDAGHYTVPFSRVHEKAIHTACSLPPHTLDDYCLPGRLADYAVNAVGFSHAEVILSGNIFNPQLLAQYGATPGCFPTNPAIPVSTWRFGMWSPRYTGTNPNEYYLVAVICVNNTQVRRFPVVGWLADLAIGMGVVGNNANMSLHWILYHDHSYTDPADGRQHWFLSTMGGADRTFWDTGVYIRLWD